MQVQPRLRCIDIPIDCPVCNETIFHVLVGCAFAKQCWSEVRLLNEDDQDCYRHWFQKTSCEEAPKIMPKVLMLCRVIWKERHNKIGLRNILNQA